MTLTNTMGTLCRQSCNASRQKNKASISRKFFDSSNMRIACALLSDSTPTLPYSNSFKSMLCPRMLCVLAKESSAKGRTLHNSLPAANAPVPANISLENLLAQETYEGNACMSPPRHSLRLPRSHPTSTTEAPVSDLFGHR